VLALPGDRILTLKAAGLSTRKAEYVLGLAERFADGSLSAARLTAATDDEVREMLIAIRGIGPWTVDMFQMFSLHRPDILPTGDLGVQKGLLSWIIQSHDPKTPLSLVVPPAPTTPHSLPSHTSTDGGGAPNYPPAFSLTTPLSPSTTPAQLPPHLALPTPAASTSTSPASTLHNLAPALPVYAPRPLPEGLTLELLKSRLAGKKAKGGAYLTPAEMEALTESWRPFRSIGVWFQWKVCDED
jgi:DNA-3-methyladenine glycosylase II